MREKKRDEWGIYTVVVSAHANTCGKCMPWQGKILIDDIFCHGEKDDGDYPLLSDAIKVGFLHPNCRHTLITYFPGITSVPVIPDGKDAVKTYEAEQKQREIERQLRKWKRKKAGSLDLENEKAADNKISELKSRLKNILSQNPKLKRNYNREEPKGEVTSKTIKQNSKLLREKTESDNIKEARQKIINKEYNLDVKFQKQQEHILGKKKWTDRARDDFSKGKSLADAFYKDVDIQKLVSENAGSGIIEIRKNQQFPIEYIQLDKNIGVAFNHNTRKYENTSRFAIRYSSKGVHAHPVLPRKED